MDCHGRGGIGFGGGRILLVSPLSRWGCAYCQGKLDEAGPFLARGVELRGSSTDPAPLIMAAFLNASRGERGKIDPSLFAVRPQQVIDGDFVIGWADMYALLSEKETALAWLRRTDELSNHNYPWFERDKNWNNLRSDPEYQRILAGIKRHWERYREEFGGVELHVPVASGR
jgi:hypothetical protein